MSDFSTNTPTIDPPTTPEGGERDTEETTTDTAATPVGRLDSPIERLDLSTPDTFIPEAVDQLLAHSRRYPLLTPAQEIELAQRIERGDLHAKELLVNS
ncbi:MAG TPA: sigma-70 factor domain-containing protein, partial [Solirubrobacteraceae bacterium]|nr:sigma-70 factor domain-containing protein [Solirubrobacteraceae bacterium]